MSSIKSNIFFNSLLVTANYIFPLLVFPYISRVLGVANIGICNFVDSVINYYCLFAMLGMNSLSIREIAANKSDAVKLSKTFSSLLSLNIIISSVVVSTLVISIFCVPRFYEYRHLMFIGVTKLIFQVLLVEWFFTGIENFRYITFRSILVRSVYVLMVFLLVKDVDDYPIYYALLTLTVVINALFNITYSRKFVRFSIFGISMKKYIKPLLSLGAYNLLTSFYTTFNVLFLGLSSSSSEVGYYTTATRLHSIILACFTAVTSVLLPRMSSLIANNDYVTVNNLLKKSTQILFIVAFPIIAFCEVFANDFILLIAGPGFENSVLCFRLIIPLIFVVGYEQILVFQILMPSKKDNMVLTNAFCAASVGIIGNFLLVSRYASLGSSIVWVASEMCVFFLAQMFARRTIGFAFPIKDFIRNIWAVLPISIILILLLLWNPAGSFTQFIGIACVVIYYFIIEIFILRNEILISLIETIKNRIC